MPSISEEVKQMFNWRVVVASLVWFALRKFALRDDDVAAEKKEFERAAT